MRFFKSRAFYIVIAVLMAGVVAMWFLPFKSGMYAVAGGAAESITGGRTPVNFSLWEVARYDFGGYAPKPVALYLAAVVAIVNIWIMIFVMIRIFKPQWVGRGVEWLPMLTALNAAFMGWLVVANNASHSGYIAAADYTVFAWIWLGLSLLVFLAEGIRLFAVYGGEKNETALEDEEPAKTGEAESV